MKKAGLLLFMVFLIGILGFSQDYKGKGRIIGYVFDEQGQPLEGVKVKLFSTRSQSGFDVKTDTGGRWIASWIRGGAWDVYFEKIGYMTEKGSIDIKEYSRNLEVRVNLKKVEGLVITDELKTALDEGNNLFQEGRYEKAIGVYAKILEEFPDTYIINKNIGNCYFRMENYDEAKKYYVKVLEKDPKNNEIILLIGNSYANRGQNDKALEWYNKIDFEEIDDPTVLYNIGTNYYNLSKFAEALKYYKKAVEIQNDFI